MVDDEADSYIIREINGFVNEMTVEGEENTAILSGLTHGMNYTFVVHAFIDIPSAASSPASILFDVPSQVMSLYANLSSRTITWVPPEGSIEVTMYQLQYTPLCSSGTVLIINTTNTSVVLSDTDPSVPYNITVLAVNIVGLGQQTSITVKRIDTAIPVSAPNNVTVNIVGDSVIWVSWSEADCRLRHSHSLEYVMLITMIGREGINYTYFIPLNQSSRVVTGLNPLTNYSIQMALKNDHGQGPYSAPIKVTTLMSTLVGWEITYLVYGSAAGFIILSIPTVLVVIFLCSIQWRKYQNGIHPKMVQGLSIEYNANRDLEEVELASNTYQALSPPEEPDRQTKLSIEIYDDFPTVPASDNEALYTPMFGHGITPTNPVKLENLPNHVARYHAQNHKKFKDEYRQLYSGDRKAVSIGFSDKNIYRNRFRNITVYDSHRIKLRPIPGCEDCQDDFINASYIDGYSSALKFIAAQGPLKNTVVDFWRLIWQEAPQYIVMVTKLKESSATKCERYWPMENTSQMYGPFKVTTLSKAILPDITRRQLKVELREVGIEITQYHFTSWPDHGVPECTGPIMALHKKVMEGWRSEGGPILVHCSAGVGRTGTFITIDLALEQTEKAKTVDIAGIVNRLREQRMQMVQTEGQYMFTHDVVLEVGVCGITAIESSKFDMLMSKLKQCNSCTKKSNLATQFEVLQKITPHPTSISPKTAVTFPEKNRDDIYLPNEIYRVSLMDEYPNYIHASFVKGYREKKTFIIAQSPMESTVRDFWKMVMDYKVPAVVMLCSMKENNTEACHCYWPQFEEPEQYGEFTVKLKNLKREGWYVLRELLVFSSKKETEWIVAQYEVKDWSQDCQVRQPATILKVMSNVITRRQTMGQGPVVVHCSDTVSRSGMYCAISNALEQCKAEGVVDVFQTVKTVRMQKPGAVSTVDQYASTYSTVKAFIDLYQNM